MEDHTRARHLTYKVIVDDQDGRLEIFRKKSGAVRILQCWQEDGPYPHSSKSTVLSLGPKGEIKEFSPGHWIRSLSAEYGRLKKAVDRDLLAYAKMLQH